MINNSQTASVSITITDGIDSSSPSHINKAQRIATTDSRFRRWWKTVEQEFFSRFTDDVFLERQCEITDLPAKYTPYIIPWRPRRSESWKRDEEYQGMDEDDPINYQIIVFGHRSLQGFKSPIEFAKHLCWLVGSASHSQVECTCLLCNAYVSSIKEDLSAAHTVAVKERQRDCRLGSNWFRMGELVLAYVSQQENPVACLVVGCPSDHEAPNDKDDSFFPSNSSSGYRLQTLQSDETLVDIPESKLRPWLDRPIDEFKNPHLYPNVATGFQIGARIAETWGVFDRDTSTKRSEDYGYRYNGCWLGPEKIWCGEAVRIIDDESLELEIFVVDAIYCDGESLSLSGDCYCQSNPIIQPKYVPHRISAHGNWVMRNKIDEEVIIPRRVIGGRWYPLSFLKKDSYKEFGTSKPTIKVNCRREALEYATTSR